MTTCGMYDAAGEWVADVGLPAKSGVGGGVLAVLPGQMGLAVYSPRLDRHGNSVRGVAATRQISRELELHFLHVASERASAFRASWDVTAAPRAAAARPTSRRSSTSSGACARVYALHGDLLLRGRRGGRARVHRARRRPRGDRASTSRACRRSPTWPADAGRRLRPRSPSAAARSALVDPDGELDGRRGPPGVRRPRRGHRVGRGPPDRAPRRRGRHHRPDPARRARPRHRPAPGGARRAATAARAPQRRRAGERIVSEGQEPAGIFFVVSGQASADVTDPDGTERRVAVLPAGTSFGKRAVISGEPHATDVRADTDLELFVLTPSAMRELERRSPRTAIALLRIMFAQSRAAAERGPTEDATPV